MKTKISSNFQQMLTVMKYEILRHRKSRRVLATVVLIVPISVLGIYLITFSGPLPLVDFTEDYFLTLTLMSAMLGIFFGSDAISSEYAQKTGYVSFTAPIGRSWLAMGKFLAAAILVAVGVAVTFAIGLIYMVSTYGAVPSGALASYILLLLYGFATLAASFLISTTIPGDILPVIFTFFIFIIIMPLVEVLLINVSVEPWFLLTFPRKLVPLASITPQPTRVSFTTAGRPIYSYPTMEGGTAVMLGYLLISLLLTLYFFRRRQMR
ncbi:MAG: ABC transporter permease [Candidatus Hadarchaeota archaeon]